MLIGASAGLRLMGANFGFMVILGLFSLSDIITINAIVLIDRIDIERDAGADPFEAFVSASVRRLRPILMTTILGLTPLILAHDPLFYGMASVIAFELLVGTILTLWVVPVLYQSVLRDAAGASSIGPLGPGVRDGLGMTNPIDRQSAHSPVVAAAGASLSGCRGGLRANPVTEASRATDSRIPAAVTRDSTGTTVCLMPLSCPKQLSASRVAFPLTGHQLQIILLRQQIHAIVIRVHR